MDLAVIVIGLLAAHGADTPPDVPLGLAAAQAEARALEARLAAVSVLEELARARLALRAAVGLAPIE